jgi:hypothetical protein
VRAQRAKGKVDEKDLRNYIPILPLLASNWVICSLVNDIKNLTEVYD